MGFTAQKDEISSFWIRAIESVDLAISIAPTTFLMAVPPGTLVLDYREGRDDYLRGVTRRAVTDVVAYADANP